MARPKLEITDAMVIEAIETANGILAQAAKNLKMSRNAIYERMEKNPAIKQAYEAANETTIDFVESALLKRINSGDTTAIIFFLKTKGRRRGYQEKVETEQSGTLNIRVTYDDSLPSDS